MISFEEMMKLKGHKIKIELINNEIAIGICTYVMERELGEDEENCIFLDENDNKYIVEQSDIKNVEILD